MQTTAVKTASGPARADADTVELLLFRLGGDSHGQRSELFGMHVANVREIVAMPDITTLAGAQPQVLGLVNLRGQVIQVLDLPAMTGCVPVTGLNIMLVTEVGGATQAFAVEAVEEIVVIESRCLSAADGLVGAIARLDDTGSSARLAQVLDLAAILNEGSRNTSNCPATA
jgi:two-component system, chemotaxis family, chemotaxis protein CheV